MVIEVKWMTVFDMEGCSRSVKARPTSVRPKACVADWSGAEGSD